MALLELYTEVREKLPVMTIKILFTLSYLLRHMETFEMQRNL